MHSAVESAYTQDLVLLGGGHTHALVLLQLAMRPLPGVRVTLVSESSMSPYSGMLPGLVAGHYRYEQVHYDLRRLCRHVGARFIHARVTQVDPRKQQVHLHDRPVLAYDTLSINVGATPDTQVPGAAQYSIAVKPISQFWVAWQQQRDLLLHSETRQRIAVVGGGAGSVELILAMAEALRPAARQHDWCLITRGSQLLPQYPPRLLRSLQRRFDDYGIQVHTDADVVKVDTEGLHLASGELLAADRVFWCTQARGASWLSDSLDVTEAGFVRVRPTLQTVSWPNIFAAGDCAWIDATPTPRAGVYAVRQAPVLAENLRRAIHQQPLHSYRPQRHFLSLLATGARHAVGARGAWSVAGKWVWYWKDFIDRRFMGMLQRLPVAPPPQSTEEYTLEPPAMRCGGCAGKLPASVLHQALATLDTGLGTGCPAPPRDDAAVLDWSASPDAELLVQSVDALKPLLDDPYLMGRIATLHALSDVFAMHASVHSAQLQLQLPAMAESLQVRDMQQLLLGVTEELEKAGGILVGGHSLEGDSLQIGLTVNGCAERARLRYKRGARAGEVLVLTKPLGSGVLFASAMRGFARAEWIDHALPWLLQSNQQAADCLADAGATALTDITGFGLAGHLLEMLAPDGLGARLSLSALPVMDGALECLAAGYESTLLPANRRVRHQMVVPEGVIDTPRYALLYDPQTQGGLLAAVPRQRAEKVMVDLRALSYQAARVGECIDGGSVLIE